MCVYIYRDIVIGKGMHACMHTYSQTRLLATLQECQVLSDFGRASPAPQPGERWEPSQTLVWPDFQSWDGTRLTLDGSSLTRSRTWPSFDPQTGAALQGLRMHMLHAYDKDSWMGMSKCWLSIMFPLGTLIESLENKGQCYFSIGAIHHCCTALAEAAVVLPLAKPGEPGLASAMHSIALSLGQQRCPTAG